MDIFSEEDKENFWKLEKQLQKEFKGFDFTTYSIPSRNFCDIPAILIGPVNGYNDGRQSDSDDITETANCDYRATNEDSNSCTNETDILDSFASVLDTESISPVSLNTDVSNELEQEICTESTSAVCDQASLKSHENNVMHHEVMQSDDGITHDTLVPTLNGEVNKEKTQDSVLPKSFEKTPKFTNNEKHLEDSSKVIENAKTFIKVSEVVNLDEPSVKRRQTIKSEKPIPSASNSVILKSEPGLKNLKAIEDSKLLTKTPKSVESRRSSSNILKPTKNNELSMKTPKKVDRHSESEACSDVDPELWDFDAFDLDNIEEECTQQRKRKRKQIAEKGAAKRRKKSILEAMFKKHPDLKLDVKVHVLRLPKFMINSDEAPFILDQTYQAMHKNLMKDIKKKCEKVYLPEHSKNDQNDNNEDNDGDDPDGFNCDDLVQQRAIYNSFQYQKNSSTAVGDCYSSHESDQDEDVVNPKPSTSKKPCKRVRMSTGSRRAARIVSDSDSDDPSFLNNDDDGFQDIAYPSDGEESSSESQLSDEKEGPKHRKKTSNNQKNSESSEEGIDRSLMNRYQKPKKPNSAKKVDDDATERLEEKISDTTKPNESLDKSVDSQGSAKKRQALVRPKSENEIENETREATTWERKRIEKLEKLQKIIEEVEKKHSNELILDVHPTTKDVRVKVNSHFLSSIKPHQRQGIRFMYSNVIGSCDLLNEDSTGCILAHCMGLGKTFQVIVLIHTLFTNKVLKEHFKRIMISVPKNTLNNWQGEFKKWWPKADRIKLFSIYNCDNVERNKRFKDWFCGGGVCIISHQTYLSSLKPSKPKPKSQKVADYCEKALLDPGPDLLVIDEGHLVKNDKRQLCKTFQKVVTARKIILTGTPLQNNLNEYHTMIDLIKPHLLGSKKEFDNRFKNPIEYGLHVDSTPEDIRLMKKMVAVLDKLLSWAVHRLNYDELRPYLKEKYEFAIFIQPTDLVIQMYNDYLDNQSDGSNKNLLKDSIVLRLVCSHPALLPLRYDKEKLIQRAREEAKKNKKKDDKLIQMEDAISQDSEDDFVIVPSKPDELDEDQNKLSNSNAKTGNQNDSNPNASTKKDALAEKNSDKQEEQQHWFRKHIDTSEECKKIELSNKFVAFFFILERCIALGEKLVVVSQCLETLDMIEYLLSNHKTFEIKPNEKFTVNWRKGVTYFRIDGSVCIEKRTTYVDYFNNPTHTGAKLFLLATKAGGIGINLFGANRCIMFDVHWNPMVDLQAIFRIYRLGQTKPVYIYRLITRGTMEEKIYKKQVLKEGLSMRVVDKTNIKNVISKNEVKEYYTIRPQQKNESNMVPPTDKLLGDLILTHKECIVDYHKHDSMLQKRPEEDLNPQERQSAWEEYQKQRDAETIRLEEEAKKAEEAIRLEEEAKQKEIEMQREKEKEKEKRRKNQSTESAKSQPASVNPTDPKPRPIILQKQKIKPKNKNNNPAQNWSDRNDQENQIRLEKFQEKQQLFLNTMGPLQQGVPPNSSAKLIPVSQPHISRMMPNVPSAPIPMPNVPSAPIPLPYVPSAPIPMPYIPNFSSAPRPAHIIPNNLPTVSHSDDLEPSIPSDLGDENFLAALNDLADNSYQPVVNPFANGIIPPQPVDLSTNAQVNNDIMWDDLRDLVSSTVQNHKNNTSA